MTITKLAYEEVIAKGFTHKLTIPYTDLTGLTSGSAYSIFPAFNAATTFPAGTRVTACLVHVSTVFTFAAGTLVAIIGDGGDTARYFASTSLKTAAWVAENALTKKPYVYDAADTIDLTITCGAGTPATIAAGSFDVFLRVEDLSTV